jgi:hypothetical protein
MEHLHQDKIEHSRTAYLLRLFRGLLVPTPADFQSSNQIWVHSLLRAGHSKKTSKSLRDRTRTATKTLIRERAQAVVSSASSTSGWRVLSVEALGAKKKKQRLTKSKRHCPRKSSACEVDMKTFYKSKRRFHGVVPASSQKTFSSWIISWTTVNLINLK